MTADTIPVPDPRFRDLDDPLAQRPIAFAVRSIPVRGAAEPDRLAGSPFAHPIGLFQSDDPLPPLGWLQIYFDSASCSICLSSVRSATSRLSWRFSSSSCLRRRSSETPSPPVLLLPAEKGLLADAHLPADLEDAGPRLRLAQGEGDLLLGELRLLHPGRPPPSNFATKLTFWVAHFLGMRSLYNC